MLGSSVLDIVIGMIFVYLLFSLLATAIREAIEARLKTRARDLEQGLRNMLGSSQATDWVRTLYEHPVISALYKGDYAQAVENSAKASLPSYIPTQAFTTALVDILIQGGTLNIDARTGALGLSASSTDAVQRVVSGALAAGVRDVQGLRRHLAAWFDDSMERLSGAYKRRSQMMILIISAGLTIGMNVDSFALMSTFSHNVALRGVIEARAERVSGGETAPAVSSLESLDLPIGWNAAAQARVARGVKCAGDTPCWLSRTAFALDIGGGWLATTLAISLGAPFWFDLLGKVMSIRSTLKPSRPADPPPPAAATPPPPSIGPSQTLATPAAAADASESGNGGPGLPPPHLRPRED